jgi:hypothetical protein
MPGNSKDNGKIPCAVLCAVRVGFVRKLTSDTLKIAKFQGFLLWHGSCDKGIKQKKEFQMNSKTIFAKTALTLALACGISVAADVSEDEDVIITSKPHRLPRLMTIQTSEVLESYAVGFAGSGNIHNIIKGSRDAMNGAVYVGLGDVAELGYDMEILRLQDVGADKRMKGHIKIQPVSEGRFMPAIALTYGTNLDNNVEVGDSIPFGLERQSFVLGASKSFAMGNHRISVHPGVTMNMDELTKIGDVKLKPSKNTAQFLGAQFGATWQTVDNTMFIFESRTVPILNTEVNANQKMQYQYGFENNLGVRFYIRNWVFLDAGILTLYDSGSETWDPGIHANLTGLLPLKAIATRIFN